MDFLVDSDTTCSFLPQSIWKRIGLERSRLLSPMAASSGDNMFHGASSLCRKVKLIPLL